VTCYGAALTWQLVGGTLFVGLPSGVTVEKACFRWQCVVPENKVVVVFQWDGEPIDRDVAVLVKAANGMASWETPVPWSGFSACESAPLADRPNDCSDGTSETPGDECAEEIA
jgi:hypothetical protein